MGDKKIYLDASKLVTKLVSTVFEEQPLPLLGSFQYGLIAVKMDLEIKHQWVQINGFSNESIML